MSDSNLTHPTYAQIKRALEMAFTLAKVRGIPLSVYSDGIAIGGGRLGTARLFARAEAGLRLQRFEAEP